METLNVKYFGTTRWWWAILVVGIFLVLGGFAYWFWPVAGYAVASQIFGWLLITAGIVQLCVEQWMEGELPPHQSLGLKEGYTELVLAPGDGGSPAV